MVPCGTIVKRCLVNAEGFPSYHIEVHCDSVTVSAILNVGHVKESWEKIRPADRKVGDRREILF